MKRLLILLWLTGHTAWASPQLRHTEGCQGISLTGGKTAMGYYVQGDYSAYISPQCYGKLALSYTWQKPYQALQIMPAVGIHIMEARNTFYLHLLLGAAATYEGHLPWNIAIKAGPVFECFFRNHLALTASLLPAYYCLKNPYGHWGYTGTLGLKITF